MGGQLVCVTSLKPREIDQEVGTLEYPDEGSPVHMRGKEKKRIPCHSDAKGKMYSKNDVVHTHF